jgi:lysophospholipase L1-like esterase
MYIKKYIVFSFFLITIWLTSSVSLESRPKTIPARRTLFDTAFTIGSLTMPDSAILARSIVSRGDVSRLRRFLKKARQGNSLRIGYIGGSITEGARAGGREARYVNRLAYFLQRLFPRSTFSVLNAGIAGTNSRFGCSRVKDDLLNVKPDMIIIEYAVNDSPNDSLLTIQSMEGLVRQCLRSDSVPVLMLLTMRNSADDTLVSHYHTIIGKHYSVPIISYRHAVWPLIASNQLQWTSISFDKLHPNHYGHLLIAYILYTFIKNIYLENDTIEYKTILIPSPYSSDLFEFAGVHSSNVRDPIKVQINKGWRPMLRDHRHLAYISKDVGDSLVVTTPSHEVTIGYRIWKHLTVCIGVKLDGRVVDTLRSVNSKDYGVSYIPFYQVYQQSTSTIRSITMTNISGGYFDIEYILYAD